MRVKTTVAALLGIFVVIAVVMVARDARGPQPVVSAASVVAPPASPVASPPVNNPTTAAPTIADTVGENSVGQTAKIAPKSAEPKPSKAVAPKTTDVSPRMTDSGFDGDQLMEAASLAVAIGTAAWLGLLTSISPCPLATNIAAIAFVSRDSGSPRRTLAAGLLYTIGRSVAYVLIAAVAVFAFGRLLAISTFLQETFYRLLGPLLIVVGMVLIGLVDLRLPQTSQLISEEQVRRGGAWAAFPLGSIFALSFCPVSAALFFGMLIPLAVRHGSPLLIPSVYGIVTGLPVVVIAGLIAAGMAWMGAAFKKAAAFDVSPAPLPASC